MFPIPVLQVSAEPTDSDTTPAELRTPELPLQTLAQSTAQDLQPVLPTNDTPIKRSCSTMQPFTTNTRCRHTTLNAMGKEMKGCLVGPMPVEQFLEEFLPPSVIPNYEPLTFSDGTFESTLSALHEMKAYEPFIDTMSSFAPGLSFINTHNHPDTTNCKSFTFQIKPDICVYADGTSPPRARQSSCDVSAAEVIIEFKWDPHHNPFYTPASGPSTTAHFISETDKAMDTLGQIMTHIIRWDREGATVSSAIFYNKEPHLADFFHRYAQALPALRGVDTLVTLASAEEARLARSQLGLSATRHMLKVAVPDVDDTGLITLVFPAPSPVGQSPIGRCTRACPAYDIDNDRVVMFKDSWRVAIADVLPEDAVWACSHNAIIPHIHYRLVLNIVGKQLCEFASSHQLVTAVRDALIAHKDTYHKAGVLHQDLSAGNIVIHDGKGILIDWDLSKLIDIKGARQVTRTGTWQFMSAHLVENEDTTHDVEDDLESSLYVILWVALLWTKTYLTVPARSLLMKQVFEVDELEGVGSSTKSAFLNSRTQLRGDVFIDRKPLDRLILALTELFALRYIVVTREQQDAYDQTCEHMEKTDATNMTFIMNLLKANPAYKLKTDMEILKSHNRIIEVYDFHLQLEGWPQDPPVEQILTSNGKFHAKRCVFTKSLCPSQVELTTSSKRRRVGDN
ncbi:uncharacterized protein F5147DRAFT_778800 [Suillus discolor]|uniref:Fungal-type protein kinase domain-containing protein n=1 Tax=Suillus discolor TaxID=1912936 RepID=A0A9P7JNW2_9AGAM|nr:uncharacterized protein F5147DRAFT_778800 [Suillus discolor]KAG2095105.1 hypothetical protein F5147DRAFT_778800 [Suillus discolor]